MKLDKRIIVVYIITIGLLLLGVTYAWTSSDIAMDVATSNIEIEYSASGSVDGTIDLDNIKLYPILDNSVDSNTSNVIRISFTVGGKSGNPSNVIYDIALNDLNVDKELLSRYVKWKLKKNNAVISSGSLSLEFDTIDNGRLVLTEIQQDLTAAGSSDSYEFVLWLSDACQEEDITKCVDTENQDYLLNKNIGGKIEVEVYTGNKKALVRHPTEGKVNDTTPGVLMGSGTSDDPYLIESIEDLVEFSNSVNNGKTYEGETVSLTKSLNFLNPAHYVNSARTDYGDVNENGTVEGLLTELTTGLGWIPIGYTGDNTKYFSGTFNGNNNEIRNLYINNTSRSNSGLFAKIVGATINDLGVTGSILLNTEVTGYSGGIAAGTGNSGNAIINNCYSKVNISNTNTSNSIGGLVGALFSGTLQINNSYNVGSVTDGQCVGGLVGKIGTSTGAGVLTINNSYNVGTVRNSINSVVGGFLGQDYYDGTSVVNINNSYNAGEVIFDKETITSEKFIGGLIASAYGTINIDSSYNIGKLISTTTSNNYVISIGGLVGKYYQGNSLTINNSYNIGTILGGSRVGGIIGHAHISNDIILNKCYNLGVISTNYIDSSASMVGGLIGYTYQSKTSILNSYNSANITNLTYSGGLLGYMSNGSTNIIVNSYSFKNEYRSSSNSSISTGIYGGTSSTFVLNNVYNIASLTASAIKGLGTIGSTGYENSITVNNAYYLNNVEYGLGDSYESYVTPMSEGDMKSSAFVNTLNSNLSSISLSSIDSSLSGYTLSSWKLGSDGYPVFDYQE